MQPPIVIAPATGWLALGVLAAVENAHHIMSAPARIHASDVGARIFS